MKKRTLSWLLVCLMLLQTLAACSEAPGEKETTGNDTTNAATPSTETAGTENTDEEPEIKPDLPSITFDGRTFTFLTSGPNDTNGVDWETYDIWVEGVNADVINDSVFERNLYLEDTYKIKLAEFKTNGATLDEIKTEVTVDTGAFDAAITHIENSANLAQSGYLLNLYNFNYINTKQPWWDQRAREDLEILGKLYFATGDITVIDNDATWVLMFNKQMLEDLQMPNLYDLVREGTWDYDTFYSLATQASVDMNGDGVLKKSDDQFGFITSGDSAYGLLYASGEKLVVTDETGTPTPIVDVERLFNVIDKSAMIMGDKDVTFQTGYEGTGSADVRIMFEEGRGLFFGEVMQCIIRMRASETDFGLLPWPKFDETQTDFYNWIHTSAGRGLVIPANKRDSEFIGVIVEAMAAKSMYTVTPAYYDVALTYKYMRDKESAEMLDIILHSRLYDLGRIYNFGSVCTTIAGSINKGANTIASTWKAMSKPFTKIIERTAKDFSSLEH